MKTIFIILKKFKNNFSKKLKNNFEKLKNNFEKNKKNKK